MRTHRGNFAFFIELEPVMGNLQDRRRRHHHHHKPHPDPNGPKMQSIYVPPDRWIVKKTGNEFEITIQPDGAFGQEYVVKVLKHHHGSFAFPNLDQSLVFCWNY